MLERYKNQILQLSQRILMEYWQGNQRLLLRYIHPDIFWIGSAEAEYIHGAEAMEQRLQSNKSEMPPVFLDEQEYEIINNDGLSCLVAGRYRAYTKPNSGILLSEKQRVTFLWVLERKNENVFPLIKHIHLSNVLKIQDDDEFFPVREGKKNYQSMKSAMSDKMMKDFVALKDSNKVSRIFDYSKVMCLQADRNYTSFYAPGKIRLARVRGNLSSYVQKLPDYYLKVNRSVIVNVNFVKSIKGRIMNLSDGSTVNIPAPKCAEIRRTVRSMALKDENIISAESLHNIDI